MKLTKTAVKNLPIPSGRQVYVYDDQVSAFGVRVSPGGTKSYFVQYRHPTTRRRKRHTIGQGAHEAWVKTLLLRQEMERARDAAKDAAREFIIMRGLRSRFGSEDALMALLVTRIGQGDPITTPTSKGGGGGGISDFERMMETYEQKMADATKAAQFFGEV